MKATSTLDGERLDRAVALLAGLSRAEAARLVARGAVRIRGSAVSSGSRRVRAGELLEIELTTGLGGPGPEPSVPQEGGPPGRHRSSGGALEAGRAFNHGSGFDAGEACGPREEALGKALAPVIVFADPYLVVVDKPAGLVVHPGAGNSQGTLVQRLMGSFPDIARAGPDDVRPGVVHRLDKGTSGLLVVARTPPARERLAKQMAARTVLRRYLALVYGELADDEGVIEAPLGRSPSHPLKIGVVQGGRPSRTHYWAVGRATSGFPATLLACRLETGRTHQVRAHLAAIGHPVVGDDRYANAGQLAVSRRALPDLQRPWLHAAELGFVHPQSGEAMSFTSKLPDELGSTLAPLGLSIPSTFPGEKHDRTTMGT